MSYPKSHYVLLSVLVTLFSSHLALSDIIYFSRYISLTLRSDCGGDKEIRTPDPLLARQVLSQLSYTPTLL